MKHLLRILALVIGLSPSLAAAQSAPAILPSNSVYGRLGGGTTGPGQAIPFVTLAAQLAVGSCPTAGAFSIGTGSAAQCSNVAASTALLNGGPLTINPTAASLNQGYVITQTGPASGSSAGPFSANLINATFNSAITGSTNPFFDNGAWQTWVAAHRVNFTVGGTNIGTGAAGTAEPFGAGFYQLRLKTATTSSADFIGLAGEAYTNTNSPNAPLHGLVGAAIVDTGATINVMNGLFAEVDINGTATVAQRRGINIVSQGAATATGSIDTAIAVSSSVIGASFKKFVVINTQGGTVQPLQTTADMFWADGAFTVANVFNLSNATVTGNILNFPNVTLSGAGILTATDTQNAGSAWSLTNSSTGTAAFSAISFTNSASSGSFGLGGTGFTALSSLLQNRVYANANSATAGLVLDASGSGATHPIIFALNDLEVGRFTGGFLNIGPAVAPDAPLTVNANTGASIAPPSGTNLHLIGADGALNRIVMDAYGQVAVMAGYRADGTQASKTAVVAADSLFIFGANGWNTSAQVASSQISFTARETFSGTASGGSISVFTTPLTTTGVVESVRFQPSGCVSLGAGAIATDCGIGSLNLTGTVIAKGSVPVGTTGSCVASSFTGGAIAGKFSAAVCAAGTIILSSLPTAPTGYTCNAQDQTTPADTLQQTATTTTSVTFKATTVAADVIVFKCMAW